MFYGFVPKFCHRRLYIHRTNSSNFLSRRLTIEIIVPVFRVAARKLVHRRTVEFCENTRNAPYFSDEFRRLKIKTADVGGRGSDKLNLFSNRQVPNPKKCKNKSKLLVLRFVGRQ